MKIYQLRKIQRLVVIYVCVALFAFWILFPLMFTVMSSVLTEREIVLVPPHWLPENPTISNYVAVLTGKVQGSYAAEVSTGIGSSVLRAIGWSALVGVVVATFNVLLGGITAWAYSRFMFPGRRTGYFFLLASRVVPAIAIVVPFFVLFRTVGLIGSPLSLIVAYNVFTLPLAIWILSSYIDALPRETEESARLEGAGDLQVLLRIVAPLALPGIVAAGLLVFLESWSEFFYALVLTNELTIPPLLAGFQLELGQFTWPSLATATVLSLLPPVVIALAFQRFLVGGLTKGAFR